MILFLIFLMPLSTKAQLIELNQQETIHTVNYIKDTWPKLTRTHQDLPLSSQDPKLPGILSVKQKVYISSLENQSDVMHELKKILGDRYNEIDLIYLPQDFSTIKEHGLLYLPYPYVVPGGRFNEMYSWDSYFIILGLLEEGEIRLAKNMVDNLVYEIDYYGTILNANRSYYLTRSNPPLLTEMVIAVYQKTKDKIWLRKVSQSAEKLYHYWTRPPHLIKSIGLSRYYDTGNGPAFEVLHGEFDEQGRNYYDKVTSYFQNKKESNVDYERFYDRAKDQLTWEFYKSDRTVRESGFDLSNQYGLFGAEIIDYLPVSLNVLLFQMEKDFASIYKILGETDKEKFWNKLSNRRKKLINLYMWNEKKGFYFDYNFLKNRQSNYIYITTFYPLWAGIASQHQAKKIVKQLPKFETRCGLLTSFVMSGQQWDAPFGWAPLHYFTIQGLKNYGYDTDAKRIALKFINLVNKDYKKYNVITEKYNVCDCSSQLNHAIYYGYASNEIGFGWTSGVYLALFKSWNKFEPILDDTTDPPICSTKLALNR